PDPVRRLLLLRSAGHLRHSDFMTGALRRHIRATAAMAVLLLAACHPPPTPSEATCPRRGAPILLLRDSASVAIAPIEGMPRATAEKLGAAMASALQEREIAGRNKSASM